jgi:glycosyltransferase involved in cell wall biosynthesis
MKIAVISLMEGVPWGGSEELWRRVVEYAIENDCKVSISIKGWPKLHPKIKSLQNKGANIILRWNKKQNLFDKIVKRLKLVRQAEKKWNFLTKEKYHHVLISFGGAYDIYNHLELQERLTINKIPYSIIQQYNEENIFLDNQQRYKLRSFFLGAENVFFVSERNKKTTERNLVCELNNSKVVSNPAINLTEKNILIDFPDLNTVKFACVARLDVGIKNQDLLIQVFSSPKWKERNFELNLYGKGPGEEYLKELISFYDLSKKITIHGHIDDINNVWKKNHCLVLVSSSEGSPLSIIEAMYSARAIIATDVGGNSELINEKCGRLIPVLDLNSIESSLDYFWKNREGLEEMGKASKKIIDTIHSNNSHEYILNLITKNIY